MAYTSGFTAVTGSVFTAAQYNTNVRDNFTAIWVYTTAGDISYATSSSTLSRLGIGTPYYILRTNAAGTAPQWAGKGGRVIGSKYDATGHTYNSGTERDMPNSSSSITVLVQSTVIVWANVIAANDAGNCWFWYTPRITSTDGNFSQNNYGQNTRTVPAFAVFTGITAGAKTILLREKEGYGAGLSYTVSTLNWVAIAFPE